MRIEEVKAIIRGKEYLFTRKPEELVNCKRNSQIVLLVVTQNGLKCEFVNFIHYSERDNDIIYQLRHMVLYRLLSTIVLWCYREEKKGGVIEK